MARFDKGEARNALARTVFFHRLSEIRDRTFESQRYMASGLNLAVAAIILWNTVYLGIGASHFGYQSEWLAISTNSFSEMGVNSRPFNLYVSTTRDFKFV